MCWTLHRFIKNKNAAETAETAKKSEVTFLRYFIKRVIILCVTLFLVSLITFLAFNLIPGDPVSLILGTNSTPKQAAALRIALGLNQSLPQRYFGWLGGFLTGNFGTSIQYSVPVKSLIASRLPVTACLAIMALVLIAVVSVPLGILAVRKRGTAIDRILNALTMFTLSVPGFFVGIIFIWVFGLLLKIFTPGGYVDYNDDFGGFIVYLFFPALAIALPNIAVTVKFLRSAMLNELSTDYIRTARSRGNKDMSVILHHAFKNSLVPVITLGGMIIAEVFSGSIIIEQVFNIPGMGRMLITGVAQRDFPIVETLVVYIAFIVVTANFLADVVARIIDPRIRYD